jgi:ATP-dependent Lhr-like helicase
VQCIASVELMLKKWNEPAHPHALHLSTLVHQILALIAQHGGIQPGAAFDQLCRTGPFRTVDAMLFKSLLRQMASPDVRLIEQSKDGTLLLGQEGEQLVDSYQFFAAFQTPKEYRVLWGTRVLGMLPRDHQVWQGQMILLGGRRWFIKEVDERSLTLTVEPASGGNAPQFAYGQGPSLSDGLVAMMREIFQQLSVPTYLNRAAIELLQEGRTCFAQADLQNTYAVHDGKEWLLFPWVGTVGLLTLSLGLRLHGLTAAPNGVAVSIACLDPHPIRTALERLVVSPPDGEELAAQLPDPAREKFDRYLGPALLQRSTASAYIQAERLSELAKNVLAGWSETTPCTAERGRTAHTAALGPSGPGR